MAIGAHGNDENGGNSGHVRVYSLLCSPTLSPPPIEQQLPSSPSPPVSSSQCHIVNDACSTQRCYRVDMVSTTSFEGHLYHHWNNASNTINKTHVQHSLVIEEEHMSFPKLNAFVSAFFPDSHIFVDYCGLTPIDPFPYTLVGCLVAGICVGIGLTLFLTLRIRQSKTRRL